ncbi:MAG: SdpI family protein [Candidatus Aenigmarchaeota archaeon]|nr:SdpI family protein [Candidatus Aenigmarchaeota archaeon]
MKRFLIIALILVILSFIMGLAFYPILPEDVPSHWNVRGEVDGYLPKFWGAFLFPIVTVGLFLLFALIPHIDPKKTNIEKMEKYYGGIVVLTMGFLFYIYILTIVWALGARIGMNIMIMPAMGILFYALGAIMHNLKSNWFVGIRTPWTLSSESVWKKTHALGGKVFKISGILAVASILFGNYALFVFIVPLLIGVGYTFVYSYLEYQKEARK